MKSLDEVIKETILTRLFAFNGNRTKTADSLKMSVRGLRYHLAKFREQDEPTRIAIDQLAERLQYRGEKHGEQ